MNKQLHRVIFNRAMGLWQVVSEIARCAGRGSSRGGRGRPMASTVTLRPLTFALWSTLGWVAVVAPIDSAWAQVISDPRAPGQQRPTVLEAANGVPLVNVQTPSAAGVSRNTYQQFDVGEEGVILNNARNNVETNLGGWVQGNPWLAAGTAKIILNEVNASNPSQLRGYVEIAGDRAQMVIANPAGIDCDGCGFINANHITLTTGKPQFSSGALDSYRVEGGALRVSGAGLDASRVGYTDLIARSLQINAGLWAQQLQVVGGVNTVNVDASQIKAQASAIPAQIPQFAVDVSQLGGMYAQKILLVGTEDGVGVRNAGAMGAQTGELLVTVDGRLENSGSMQAGVDTRLSASDGVVNRGLISAARELAVETQQEIDNRNGTLNGLRVDLQADRLLNREGLIEQTGVQVLAVQAGTVSNREGGRLGAAEASPASNAGETGAGTGTGSGSQGADNTVGDNSGNGGDAGAGGAGPAVVAPLTDGAIRIAGALDNDAGVILAGGSIDLASASGVDNESGRMSLRHFTQQDGDLNNRNGLLDVTGDARVEANTVRNDSGQWNTGSALSIDAQQIYNRGGELLHSGSNTARIQVAGLIDNAASTIASNGALNLQAQLLANAGGAITAAGNAASSLQVEDLLDNTANGLIAYGGDATIAAGRLDNRQGIISANGNLNAQVDQGLDNRAGSIASSGVVSIEAGSIDNREQGMLASTQGDVALRSGSLSNDNGVVSAAGDLAVTADMIDNRDGTLFSGATQSIAVGRLSGDGKILAQGDLTLASQQDLDHGGQITANGKAELAVVGKLTNRGTIEAGDLTLRAQDIDNAASGKISGLRAQIAAANSLSNRGLIDGQGVRVDARELDNIGSGRIYGDTLAIQASTLSNREETVDGTMQAATIAARERLDIGAQTLINREQALIFSAGSGEQALNIGGVLDDSGQATGTATQVLNASATIESLGGLTMDTTRLLNSNEHLATALVQVKDPVELLYIQPKDNPNKFNSDQFVWENWSRAGRYRWKDDPPADTSAVLGQSPIPRVGEQDCTGPEGNEVCTRQAGADYLAGNPAWAYFAVTEPEPEPVRPDQASYADPAEYQAAMTAWSDAYAVWSTQTDQRYTELDGKIETYNDAFTAGEIRAWTQYEVVRTEYETQVISSAPGQILSGGNMTLRGDDLINDKSYILAGGALRGSLDQLDNVAAMGESRVNETGTSQYTRSRWRGGFKRYHQRDWDEKIAYTPADRVISIDLNVTRTEENVQVTGTGYQLDASGTNLSTGQNPVAGLTTAAGQTVTAASINTNVPTSSLFSVNPNAGVYLIETDPQFTDYRNWLSSDYLLAQISLDPVTMQKRLGDGFYEQKLVREQVAQLTGRRFLQGYADDEAQYRALLNAGVTYAREWGLRPGVGLSAEQMAQLTSDMVWLVEQTITLPDGSTTQALVPKLYVQLKPGDIDGKGTLISAERIDLNLRRDLSNSGTVAGRTVVQLTGENLRNLGGRISGDAVSLKARQDLDNVGGRIDAADLLQLQAGQDINVRTTTRSDSKTAGLSDFSRTNIDRVAGLYISNPGGLMVASAGNDLNLQGAQIRNDGEAGQTLLAAGRNLNLGTVRTAEQENNVRNADNYLRQGNSQEVGTSIATRGDVQLQAGQDLSARAAEIISREGDVVGLAEGKLTLEAGESSRNWSEGRKYKDRSTFSSKTSTTRNSLEQTRAIGSDLQGENVILQSGADLKLQGSSVDAQNQVALMAKGDVIIGAAEESASSASYSKVKQSGLSADKKGITAGRSMQSTDRSETTTNQAGSLVGGREVNIQSTRDVQIKASTVVADQDVNIDASRNVTIEAGTNTQGRQQESQSKSSSINLLDSGLNFSGVTLIGINQSQENGSSQSTTAAASTVGSLGGDLNIRAGQNYQQTGSDLLSPQGDINIQARKIDIVEARETNNEESQQRSKSITLGAKPSGTIVNVINSVRTTLDTAQATSQTNKRRSQALGAAATAASAMNTATAVDAAISDPASVGIDINLGMTQSKSQSSQIDDTARGSTLSAGNNLNLIALGAGEDSDIRIRGSDLSAGNNALLKAEGDLDLEASQDQSTFKSSNSSSGASLGVGIKFGSSSGFTLNAAANQAKGKGNGQDTVQNNTRITAGNKVTLESGDNTTLKGAVVNANQIVAKVGGDLKIESLQDTSNYSSQQKSSGAGVSLCIPPICYGTSSVSGSMSKQNIDSSYASVTEQSGLKAGDGGFQVNVKGNTELKGGAITSSQAAVESQQNTFKTQKLSLIDIQNKASYEGEGYGISASVGFKLGDQSTAETVAEKKAAAQDPGNSLGVGFADDSGSASSITKAAISGIAGNTEARTGDEETGIQPIFDSNKVQKELDAQTQITRVLSGKVYEFSEEVSKDAYRTMFTKEHKIYQVELNKDGTAKRDDKGNPIMRELSDEEKMNLQAGPDGKVRVSFNGIYNDEIAAANYAAQHNTEKDGPLYMVAFPKADGKTAELLVAGYQNVLEGNIGDLTNSTIELKTLGLEYGQSGLVLYGHSRGSMTIGNALQSLEEDGAYGALSNTQINFYGPAESAQKTADSLYRLSGGTQDSINLQNHKDDFVGGVLGWNPTTYGERPKESSKVQEWANMFSSGATVHSCYGTGKPGCEPRYGLAESVQIPAQKKP